MWIVASGKKKYQLTCDNRAIVGAAPYHDTSEEGKFYAVVLEQVRE